MIRELLAFFVLAFSLSWVIWMPAVFSGAGVDSAWVRWLLYAGVAGPGVAALILLYSSGTSAERADFWDRVFELRRIGPRWLALILLGYPMLTVLAMAIDSGWFAERSAAHAVDAQVLSQLLASPTSLLAYAGFTLLLGPIPEELGWRGYALDRVRSHWTPLTSSLLLGVVWCAWHLPQFQIPGTYHSGLGTVGFVLFMATALGLSVLMTWIYEATEHSILAAILCHGVVNFTRATVMIPETVELIRTALLLAAAITIAWWWRRAGAQSSAASVQPHR